MVGPFIDISYKISLIILFCLEWGIHFRSRQFALSGVTPYQAFIRYDEMAEINAG